MTQSAIILSFATEAFGKAVMLRRAYESGDDPVSIQGFYEHQDKLDVAASFIGQDPLRFRARLLSLYADWAGQWTWNDAALDPRAIKEGIDAVQGAIVRTALEEWT
ncbi:MAG: hypothetical protein DMF83_08390 [Acidobacteria bacterium]|nr:MAG: hypothetical protein DMF83_08390 [Acidobacteriota bacterium]